IEQKKGDAVFITSVDTNTAIKLFDAEKLPQTKTGHISKTSLVKRTKQGKIAVTKGQAKKDETGANIVEPITVKHEYLWEAIQGRFHEIDSYLTRIKQGKVQRDISLLKIESIKRGRLQKLYDMVFSRNQRIVEMSNNLLAALDGQVKYDKLLANLRGLSNFKWLDEPEYAGIKGSLKQCVNAVKSGNINETLIRQTMGIVQNRAETSDTIYLFLQDYRELYEKWMLGEMQELGSALDVFAFVFMEYLEMSDRIRGRPARAIASKRVQYSPRRFWTCFYQAVFIKFRIDEPTGKREKNKPVRIFNPVFQAIQDMILIQRVTDLNKILTTLKRKEQRKKVPRKNTAEMIKSLVTPEKNNFGQFSLQERRLVEKTLAQEYGLDGTELGAFYCSIFERYSFNSTLENITEMVRKYERQTAIQLSMAQDEYISFQGVLNQLKTAFSIYNDPDKKEHFQNATYVINEIKRAYELFFALYTYPESEFNTEDFPLFATPTAMEVFEHVVKEFLDHFGELSFTHPLDEKSVPAQKEEVHDIRKWTSKIVTEGIDVEKVKDALYQIKRVYHDINHELDEEQIFTEEDFSDQLIEQYGHACERFNKIILNGPMTAESLEKEYLDFHKKLGKKGMVAKPGMYYPEYQGIDKDVKKIFKELFSEETEKKIAEDPIKEAAYVFARLVRLQPFSDGNKRAASFIMNYVLMKSGYDPFMLTEDNIAAYRQCTEPTGPNNAISKKSFSKFLDDHVTNNKYSLPFEGFDVADNITEKVTTDKVEIEEELQIEIVNKESVSLRDISNEDSLVKNMIESVLSILLSNNKTEPKLVLAFHKKIFGFDKNQKITRLIEELEQLKIKPGFDRLLKNLTLIKDVQDEEDISTETLQNKGIDISQKDTHVFMFTPESVKDEFADLPDVINSVFINEGNDFNAYTNYYPIAEIVTMTLVKYHKGYTAEQILQELKGLGIELKELSIETITDTDKKAFVVFKL
ncbi:MAG: Fic family protein, partial [Candidatus Omnitrophica bacterium]|nr:Fic family protein [Candidatus Omnitrophota bacterium]